MDRFDWLRRIAALDPAHPTEAEEIHKITAAIEFPWDVRQALGLALFRTYAVPSVGELLARTGEFTAHTQKRYDDTVLLLGATVDRGFDDPDSRTAIRRMNQMHRRYGIGNDDMLYVLSTFVVTPLRWLDEFGWRRLHPHERRAAVTHYRALGRRMGIRDMPEDEAGFAALMDGVEAERFAHTAGGREVADATLALLATFPPVLGAAGRPRPSVHHVPHGPAPAARAALPGADAGGARRDPGRHAAAGRGRAPHVPAHDADHHRRPAGGALLPGRLRPRPPGHVRGDGQTVVRRGRSIPSVKCSAAARSHISRRSSPSGTGKRSHVRARPAAGVSAGPQTSANS